MKTVKTIFVAAFISSALTTFAFDWPHSNATSDSMASDFGQLRGGVINSSVIFKEDAEVYSSDKGKAIAIIDDHSDDFGWFESPLGTAIIIAHNDGLTTVYGNLTSESLHENVKDETEIINRARLGTSGNSAWQEDSNGLEFKVYDRKNLAAVNPKILMPRIPKEPHLEAGTISLCDKNGTFHQIGSERRLPAGTYFVYKTRQISCVPYKTIVSVNGDTVETIVYDTLKESNGKLVLNGNSGYSISDVYPEKDKQLLAKINLVKGQSTVTVSLVNIQENTTTLNYKLDIY